MWKTIAVQTLIWSFVALTAVACADGGNEDSAAPTLPAVLAAGPSGPYSTEATSDPNDLPTPIREPQLVSLDWLASQVAVPGLDGQPAAPVLDAGLQEAVNGALAGFEGSASFVVHNLSDGRYAATNESQVWYAASTFKAAVLLTAYQLRDAGELDFDKVVTLEEKYVADDLGTLEYLELEVGDQISIRDAVKGMIVVSDTPLAILMTDKLSGNAVDATLRDVGATTMSVNSRDLPTTALDLAQLMIAIVAGQGVTAESRDEMLSLMAQEWFTEGIVAGLPSGTQYAHKSGRLGDSVHDAAIVWSPSGPYVIIVMTDGSGGWSPIAAVSSTVWQYLEANP